MTLKETLITLFKKYFPYLVIFAAALLSCYVYFFENIASGDDIVFHLSMVNDVLYGFEHGYFGLSTNHLFMGGFAFYNYGFYGPITHYGAAIFVTLFKWTGATAMTGIKFMVIASGLLGGIYMYKLALKISNGNRIVALIGSLLFVFLPYRIFCALARCAFAESVAMALMPMVFYGAYSFMHDKKEDYHVEPYVAFAIGAILITLSHPFTGLITAIFGLLYVLFNVKNIINNRKNYPALISLGAAIIIIIFCVLFYITTSMYYEGTNLYNLSNAERQWTTYEHIASETSRTYNFSGFINIIHINGAVGNDWWNNEDVSSIMFSSLLYFIAMICAITADLLLGKLKHSIFYKHAAATIIAFALPLIFRVRAEIYIALAISLVAYFFISFLIKKLPDSSEENVPLYRNIDLYFLAISIVLCIILLFVPEAWLCVPPILYKGQFAWRMWSITAFLVAMLVSLLLSHFKTNKALLIGTSVIECSIVTLTMGTLEKRIAYEIKSKNIVEKEDDNYEYAMKYKYSGVQNEMAPQIFYSNEYTSEYANSLYLKVRNAILGQYNFFYDQEHYYDPAFLEGSGAIEITEYNSPNNKFHIEVTSDKALIQFPQIYYNEYAMYSGSKYLGSAKNVDGLIAFELNKGSYDVALSFKGSKGYQITRPLFYIGTFLLISGGVFGCVYRHTFMKKKEDE